MEDSLGTVPGPGAFPPQSPPGAARQKGLFPGGAMQEAAGAATPGRGSHCWPPAARATAPDTGRRQTQAEPAPLGVPSRRARPGSPPVPPAEVARSFFLPR